MSAATPIVGDVHPEVVDGVIPKSQPTATPIAQPPTTVPASPSQAIGTRLRGVSNSLNSARSSVAVTRAREHGAKVSAALGGARQRAVELGNHPVAVRAQGIASANANRARDILGRSETIRSAEKLTGIDRLLLVIGGNVLFALLVPYNILGLAHPITTALCLAGPTYHAAMLLDDGNIGEIDNILLYFVFFGLVQTIESLAAGFLEANIPKYYTIKLFILGYLGHPRWKGASKIYDVTLRKLVGNRAAPIPAVDNTSGGGYAVQPDKDDWPPAAVSSPTVIS
ncbi:uncharacterized protein EHS24_000549 [Apiotrichum porosum]|uniref:Protein YOP1 n=1 Tax=Apiotrichum porosum TaxID=105984 RepID=A0A427YAH6_9TREE|nr:uncharacterized protein EHS24_000549 [Apiotrichum porosum]RSH88025.1 hypothetical protein EHS24_000549 [Apiotrichum porosum]